MFLQGKNSRNISIAKNNRNISYHSEKEKKNKNNTNRCPLIWFFLFVPEYVYFISIISLVACKVWKNERQFKVIFPSLSRQPNGA